MVYGFMFLSVLCVGLLQLDINVSMYEMQSKLVERDYLFIVNRLYPGNNSKKNKRLLISISSFLLGFVVFDRHKLIETVVYSMVLGFVVYKLHYGIIKEKYKQELKKAELEFPYYLNALSILLQSNPVPVAILKSVEMSPKIFVQDLTELIQDLHEGKKGGVRPYLTFSNKFPQIKDLNRIMRSLYNLTITSANNDKVMTSLTKLANEKINIARKQKYDQYLDKQALLPWLSFLWVGFVIIAMFTTMNIGQLF